MMETEFPTFPIVTPPAARRPVDDLAINPKLVNDWLVRFLREELVERRGFRRAVVGLSGGVDSSLVTYLAAQALGPKNTVAVRMPYKSSSPESLLHAQMVIDRLGLESETVEITAPVDAYLQCVPEASPRRRGNVMARMRMITLFDLSERHRALPLGTGNKSERLLGYFTWHADDSPPINPIGDLFKTPVWQLARHLGVPEEIVSKPASADLIVGQTDEADFGLPYAKVDRILNLLLQGYRLETIESFGFTHAEVMLVKTRLDSTHWKRQLPTIAVLSSTAIGSYYLRPVDY